MSKKIKNDKPKLEVSKFTIEYDLDNISKMTEYNPDGSLKYVDLFLNKEKKVTKEWYNNNIKHRESTTEYMDCCHKTNYYGWRTLRNGEKREWNYTFEYKIENNQVKEFTRFDNGKKEETVKFIYDKKGLLIEMRDLATEKFKYEFYK